MSSRFTQKLKSWSRAFYQQTKGSENNLRMVVQQRNDIEKYLLFLNSLSNLSWAACWITTMKDGRVAVILGLRKMVRFPEEVQQKWEERRDLQRQKVSSLFSGTHEEEQERIIKQIELRRYYDVGELFNGFLLRRSNHLSKQQATQAFEDIFTEHGVSKQILKEFMVVQVETIGDWAVVKVQGTGLQTSPEKVAEMARSGGVQVGNFFLKWERVTNVLMRGCEAHMRNIYPRHLFRRDTEGRAGVRPGGGEEMAHAAHAQGGRQPEVEVEHKRAWGASDDPLLPHKDRKQQKKSESKERNQREKKEPLRPERQRNQQRNQQKEEQKEEKLPQQRKGWSVVRQKGKVEQVSSNNPEVDRVQAGNTVGKPVAGKQENSRRKEEEMTLRVERLEQQTKVWMEQAEKAVKQMEHERKAREAAEAKYANLHKQFEELKVKLGKSKIERAEQKKAEQDRFEEKNRQLEVSKTKENDLRSENKKLKMEQMDFFQSQDQDPSRVGKEENIFVDEKNDESDGGSNNNYDGRNK